MEMMYHVSAGNDKHDVDTREAAIVLAKDLSANTHRPGVVADVEETEMLTYQQGELSKYQYEPRRRRK